MFKGYFVTFYFSKHFHIFKSNKLELVHSKYTIVLHITCVSASIVLQKNVETFRNETLGFPTKEQN